MKYLILFLAIFIFYPNVSHAALTDNIVSYWKLDETSGSSAADATGNGHTAILNGTAAFDSGGKINYGIRSNTNYATLSAISLTGDFTISGWYKPVSATPSNGNVLVGGASSYPNLNFYATNFRLYSGSADTIIASYASTDQAYHFYVITRSGTTYTIYVDGSSNATATAGVFTFSVASIGGDVPGGASDAYEDEVGVWSRALTSTEISSLYNGGAGFQLYPSVPAVNSILSRVWSMWW